MQKLTAIVLCATCLVFLGCTGQELTRAQRWQKDFAALDRDFPKHQIDPWGRVSHAEWRQEIARLKSLPIQDLTDAEIACQMEHLLARYHDGHIKILTDGSTAEPEFLPVRFRWFPEGIYVTASADPELYGARLLQLGDLTPEALLQRLAPWVSIENDSGLHAAVSTSLFNAAVLAEAGIISARRSVSLRLQLPSKDPATVLLQPRPYASIAWQPQNDPPLYRQLHTPANWMTVLPDGHALYLRYASCSDASGSRTLARRLTEALTKDPTLRVVIDLRGNEGGDSAAFAPVLAAIQGLHARERHQLAALTDRLTFSSAFRNTVELKQIGATIIGEAPSQRPVYTGEVKSFALPESHLQIRYTTRWSRLGPAQAMELAPDLLIQPTPKEYLSGKDPVLDKALSQPL